MNAEAGLTFFLDIETEKTDHLWMVLTQRVEHGHTVLVMLTDVRNVELREIEFPAGYRLAERFTTSKSCCIDFARARLAPTTQVEWILRGQKVRLGTGFLLPDVLQSIRGALLRSRAAPPAVVEYCRGLGWERP